jgi:hypothetical protein
VYPEHAYNIGRGTKPAFTSECKAGDARVKRWKFPSLTGVDEDALSAPPPAEAAAEAEAGGGEGGEGGEGEESGEGDSGKQKGKKKELTAKQKQALQVLAMQEEKREIEQTLKAVKNRGKEEVLDFIVCLFDSDDELHRKYHIQVQTQIEYILELKSLKIVGTDEEGIHGKSKYGLNPIFMPQVPNYEIKLPAHLEWVL